jgi:hypothetical protein
MITLKDPYSPERRFLKSTRKSRLGTMRKLILILTIGLFALANADQGMTSPTHSDNVGKIVFSSEEIKFKNEDAGKLKTVFKLGDPIYGRMYFQQSLANTPLFHTQGGEAYRDSHRDGSWKLLLSVDGENQGIRFGNFAQGKVDEKAEKEWTTWQINLAPDQAKLGEKNIVDAWIKVAARLKPGKHTIKLSFQATLGQYESKPMAVGSFDIVVAEGASFAAGAFPASTYQGADLTSLKERMKNALVGPVAKSASEVIDVAVTSDWNHGRYTDTLVEYRKIQGTVLWADSDGDGVNRYTTYSFIQDKQGSGWSGLRFNAFVNGGLEGNVKR